MLLLLDRMFHSFTFFHSFCSTCCSSPLTWLVALFFLLDLLLRSSCSISLFLSNYYSTPLAWPLCSSTYLLHSWFWGSLFLLFNPVVLLLLFQIGTPPPAALLFFANVKCGGVVQIQVFQNWVLQAKLGKWKLLCLIFVCWWIFLIIHVFGKWWLIMCFLFLCKNYLDIVRLIIHIASHFYILHFICTIALCIFSAHCFFFLSIVCKCFKLIFI